MRDTTRQAADRYRELLAQATPTRRIEIFQALITASREMALAGLRQELPGATPKELRVALASRLYGAEIAERVFRRE